MQPTLATAEAPAARPAPAPTPAIAASPGDDAAGGLRALLRETVGCGSTDFLKLTADERRRCETRIAGQAYGGPAIGSVAGSARIAEFEASLRRRAVGQVMPPRGRPRAIVGECGGAGGVYDSIRIGPCSVGIPGIFNDDDVPSH
jgi:hypothetical protein